MTSTIDAPETTPGDAWEDKISRLRGRKPAEISVTLYDEAAAAEVKRAGAAVATARVIARGRAADGADLEADEAVIAARAALAAAEAASDAADVVLTFRQLPPHVYEGLVGKHPPTDADEEAGLSYNPLTFNAALVAACSTDPMTPRNAAELIGGIYLDEETGEPVEVEEPVLNLGETRLVLLACREVNETPRLLLGKGSRLTRS